MSNVPPSATAPDGRSRVDLVGYACGGVMALLLNGVLSRLPLGQFYSLTTMSLLWSGAVLAGFLTVVTKLSCLKTPSQAIGTAIQLGCRSGLRAVLFGGAVLVFMAFGHAIAAPTAATELHLKSRLWLTWWVVIAALLPGVFGGLIGGILGARVIVHRLSSSVEETTIPVANVPWQRWLSLSLLWLALAGLASPLVFLMRAPRIDPPVLTASPPAPPPFLYEPPPGIQSAGIGEIQPSFTKVIESIREDAPMSLSADGRWLAYGDTASSGSVIGVYDLHRFQKVASIQVPSYPQESLAWSPDLKSLACAIGSGSDRRIWILRLAGSKGIALPRPPGRDAPGGELFWWQEHELVFFSADEPPLVFDLEKLLLKPLDESPFFSKLDAETRRRWLEGPRISLPSQEAWKLDVRTVIRSVTPPPRRKPEADWEMFGDSLCAMSHPGLPVSFGFDSLVVHEGTRVLCAPDGSKLIRVVNGRAEVTYMTQAAAPLLHFEVSMPLADDAVKESEWRRHAADGELCVLVCAPLINPLNHQVVGPDYQQVRGIAQLVEWKGRHAVFLLQTYGRPVQASDIATTLHAWVDGHKTMWNEPAVSDWWAAIQPVARELPQTLADLHMPTLLALNAGASPFVVVKAPERPRPAPHIPDQGTALIPSALSQVPFSMPGSGAGADPTLVPPGMPSAAASSTPPSTSPPPTEAEVTQFVTAHHAKASQGDVAGMAADYDEMVDFLDKGRVPRSAIQAEELQQRQKWPRSSEAVLGPVTVARAGEAWVADYTIEFHNENATGESLHGKADLNLTVAASPAGLRIIGQKAKVHDVRDSRSVTKAGPAGVPVTVPRPCYVTSMRAADTPEIEITDQISFIDAVTWHRTYRELSKDGRVLNLCRAIYEGDVVSRDGQSVEVYVGAQGWERGLGKPAFIRQCERSAAAFVGRRFQFRFTGTGMTEAQGIVFELRK